jgi:hypothetical protein
VVWSVFDALPPDPTATYEACHGEADYTCYTHVNQITYNADDDSYLVTAYFLHAAMKIDRASGSLVWLIGSDRATLESPGGDALLEFPHSVEEEEGGILVFDNVAPFAGGAAAAAHFDLDLDQGTAEPTWIYVPAGGWRNDFLGNAQRLPNGNVLAVFSRAGAIEEVAPDGSVVRRVASSLGWSFLYAQREASLYGETE